METQHGLTGRLHFWNSARGYGFIRRTDAGRDVFVHLTSFEANGLAIPPLGTEIRFHVGANRNGQPMATDLKLV